MTVECTGNSVACGRSAAPTATIRSLLVLHNLRVDRIGDCAWAPWWAQHAARLLPGLRAEIERLSLAVRQIRTLETQQQHEVCSGAQPSIALLARLAGIGTSSAWTLVRELFGWRQFTTVAKWPAAWAWPRRLMPAA